MIVPWDAVPVFGERRDHETYRLRPSAYALLEDDGGRLAVVRSVDGIFLPGGGMETGETPEEAIRREALEECGLILRPGAWTRHAVQFSYSRSEAAHFEKRCTFMEASIEGVDAAQIEPNHELIWASVAEAADLLSHPSQSWAVKTWARETGARSR